MLHLTSNRVSGRFWKFADGQNTHAYLHGNLGFQQVCTQQAVMRATYVVHQQVKVDQVNNNYQLKIQT